MKRIWRIDHCLLLHPEPTLPPEAKLCPMPERAIDTILARNLPLISHALLNRSASFLFNSFQYWDTIDLGAVLSDGTFAFFENKRGRPSSNDLNKFANYVDLISKDVLGYAQIRFEHFQTNWNEYELTARRMFAGFFLRVSANTEPDSRDLAAEACNLHGVDSGEFEQRNLAGNNWLQRLRPPCRLEEYLTPYPRIADPGTKVRPIFLARGDCSDFVAKWSTSAPRPVGRNALLIRYEFLNLANDWPEWLVIEPLTIFAV